MTSTLSLRFALSHECRMSGCHNGKLAAYRAASGENNFLKSVVCPSALTAAKQTAEAAMRQAQPMKTFNFENGESRFKSVLIKHLSLPAGLLEQRKMAFLVRIVHLQSHLTSMQARTPKNHKLQTKLVTMQHFTAPPKSGHHECKERG